MNVFANIADFIASAPAAVWVDTDGQSGFTYTSEEAIEEHGEMGKSGSASSPSGTESFRAEGVGRNESLTSALIEAGIAYEAN